MFPLGDSEENRTIPHKRAKGKGTPSWGQVVGWPWTEVGLFIMPTVS